MRRIRVTRIMWGVGAALVVLCLVALNSPWAEATACDVLEHDLPAQLGATVAFERCEFQPFRLRTALHRVHLQRVGSASVEATARLLAVSISGVLPWRVSLGEVTLEEPKISIHLGEGEGEPTQTGCNLRALERLNIDALRVDDAELRLERADSVVALRGVRVETRGGRDTIRGSIDAEGGTWTPTGGRPLSVQGVSTEFELKPSTGALTVGHASVAAFGSKLDVSGTVEDVCRPDAPLAIAGKMFVSAKELDEGLGLGVGAKGSGWLQVSASGTRAAPALRLDVSASDVAFQRFTPGTLTAALVLKKDVLLLEHLEVSVGAGVVTAQGQLSLKTPYPFEAEVSTHDASFGRILEHAGVAHAWVDFSANMKGKFTGAFAPSPVVRGETTVGIQKFEVTARPFDTPQVPGRMIFAMPALQVETAIDITAARTSFNGAVITTPSGHTRVRADAVLHHDFQKGLEIAAAIESLGLDDTLGISEAPWGGVLEGRASLIGPYNNVTIDSRVSGRDVMYFDYHLGSVQTPVHYAAGVLSFPAVTGLIGKTAYSGTTRLDFLSDGVHVNAAVDAPGARVEDLVDVLADLHPSIESLQHVLTGSAPGSFRFEGPAREFEGVVQLEVSDLAYYGRRFGRGPLKLRFEKGAALVLEPFHVEGPMGASDLKGRWVFHGPLDFDFSVDRAPIEELLGAPLAARLLPQAHFRFAGKAFGNSDAPKVQASLTSPELLVRGLPLGGSAFSLTLENRVLRATGNAWQGAPVDAQLVFRAPYPWDLKVQFDLDPIRLLFADAANWAISSNAVGSAALKGALKDDAALEIHATVDTVRLARGDATLTATAPVVVDFQARRGSVAPVALRGTNTQMVVGGDWGPAGFDFSAKGLVDARFVEAVVPVMERSSGVVELALAASRQGNAASLTGTADIRDVRFGVRGQPVLVRNMSGRVEFSQSKLLLRDLEAVVNDGHVRARGDATLDGFDPAAVELSADLDDVNVPLRADAVATVGGALLLHGPVKKLQLSGTLDVARMRYTQQVALDSFLQDVGSRSARSGPEGPPRLYFDLGVDLSGDVRIDNNLARAQLGGKLRVQGTDRAPELTGVIEAKEGAQATFRGNAYAINRARVHFAGTTPTVDFAARTQVREYAVNVKAFGRIDDPTVSLTAEPSLSEGDVLALLTLGITSREGVSTQTGATLAAEALLSASGLDRQVQRFLSRTKVLKDQQVHLSTSYNEATGQAEPSVVFESKVVSDRLKVGVTQPVTGRGTRAHFEYQVAPGVSAKAQWDNQSQDSSYGNPGLDVRFRFEWE